MTEQSWTYEAMNTTIRCVKAAFFVGMFKKVRNFFVVSEPEACALFTVQDMLQQQHDGLYEVNLDLKQHDSKHKLITAG